MEFLFSRDEHCLAPGAGMVLSLPWPCGMPWMGIVIRVGSRLVNKLYNSQVARLQLYGHDRRHTTVLFERGTHTSARPQPSLNQIWRPCFLDAPDLALGPSPSRALMHLASRSSHSEARGSGAWSGSMRR